MYPFGWNKTSLLNLIIALHLHSTQFIFCLYTKLTPFPIQLPIHKPSYPEAEMGAWGLGLFGSDYGYDVIDEPTSEVSLRLNND